MKNKNVNLKNIRKFKFGGLEGKVLNLCLMLIILVVAAFSVIGILQLVSITELTEESSERQVSVIKEHTEETIRKSTELSLMDTTKKQAKLIDGEFWTLRHDFVVLSTQLQRVFDQPEMFTEHELSRPQKKNAGIMTGQLMSPNKDGSVSKESLHLLRRIATLTPMMKEIVEDNSTYIMDCIVALPDGSSMVVDSMSDQKYDENGKIKVYDPRTRPWYIGASQTHNMFFSPAIHSFFYNLTEVVFGVPIYNKGKLVAVLEGSIMLDMIQDVVNETLATADSYGILINKDGQVVYSPFTEGDLAMDDELSTNAYDTDNEELKTLLTKALSGKTSLERITINNEKYYVAYSAIDTIGWTMMSLVPEKNLMNPSDELLKKVDAISKETKDNFSNNFSQSLWITIVVLIILVINAVFVSTYFARRLLNPIRLMTKQVETLSGDNLNFEVEKEYLTGDEIEVLAGAFSDLSEKTREYIREIMQISAEKEKIATELSIASKIQKDSLISTFPAFPDRKDFDVYASMTPAKAVGGDFYDMFFVDDDHLAVVVADVSDKGVPAALFMMISKTLIRVRAKMGGTPAEILMDINNQLAENNHANMFVTVFLAIMDTNDGSMLVANAGHEYPVVRPAGRNFDFIRGKHGFVVGAIKGMKYQNIEFTAHPGDMFFLYTDGVSEANDANDEQFGEERMLEALNSSDTDNPGQLLEHVRQKIDEFVGDAPQFDDLTMLAFTYYGKEGL